MRRRVAGTGFALALVLVAGSITSTSTRTSTTPSTSASTKPLPAALSGEVSSWAAHKTCVVVSRQDGVYFVDLASGSELRLPGVLPAGEQMRFSPRGDRVAMALKVEGKSDVYLLDLSRHDGPRLHRLTLSGGGDPRWLGRGERLLYQAPDAAGGAGIFVRDDGGLGPALPFWDERPVAAPVPATVS